MPPTQSTHVPQSDQWLTNVLLERGILLDAGLYRSCLVKDVERKDERERKIFLFNGDVVVIVVICNRFSLPCFSSSSSFLISLPRWDDAVVTILLSLVVASHLDTSIQLCVLTLYADSILHCTARALPCLYCFFLFLLQRLLDSSRQTLFDWLLFSIQTNFTFVATCHLPWTNVGPIS